MFCGGCVSIIVFLEEGVFVLMVQGGGEGSSWRVLWIGEAPGLGVMGKGCAAGGRVMNRMIFVFGAVLGADTTPERGEPGVAGTGIPVQRCSAGRWWQHGLKILPERKWRGG